MPHKTLFNLLSLSLVLSICHVTASAEDLNPLLTVKNVASKQRELPSNSTNCLPTSPTNSAGREVSSNATAGVRISASAHPAKRGPKKSDSKLPSFEPWETFWIDHDVKLVESRARASLPNPGVVDVVVVLPNELSESQEPVVLPYSAVGIRELNVVVVPEQSGGPVVLDGPYSGAVIGAVVQSRYPRRVSHLLGETNLLAGTVVVQGSRAPEQVNMISKIDRIETRQSVQPRRKLSTRTYRSRP